MQRAHTHKEYRGLGQHPDASHSYARQHPDRTEDTPGAALKYVLRVLGGGIFNKLEVTETKVLEERQKEPEGGRLVRQWPNTQGSRWREDGLN
jgi:hypothetical protein